MAKQFTRKVTEKTVYDNDAVITGRASLIEVVEINKSKYVNGNEFHSIVGNKTTNLNGHRNESVFLNKTETIGGKKIVNVPVMEFPALGNFASDAAANAGGVLVGELYFDSALGNLKKRLV